MVCFCNCCCKIVEKWPNKCCNTAMYERMVDDMDINCGDIITGGATIQSKGREIYDLFLRVASGEASKSEAQGLGDYEFVPWQIGAVM